MKYRSACYFLRDIAKLTLNKESNMMERIRQFPKKISNNALAIGLILLIIFCFFASKWVLEGAYFKNDLVIITIPLEDLYARIQRSGQSPLWAPELAGGYPLLAIGQLGYWYPLHMLLRQFLPAVWTLNLSLMLHAMLGAIGTYLFLKINKVNPIAAATAALLFPLGGVFVGKYEMINLVLPFMWLPLIFLFLQGYMVNGKLKFFLFWVGANVFCVLMGHPQMTVYVLFSEAIFVLCLTLLSWQRWSRALATLLGVILIIGLTSFYLLPIVDNLPATDRANGSVNEDPSGVFDYQFSPAAFMGLIVAHPFGHADAYRGPSNESELSCYVGPIALGLALIGFIVGRRKYPIVWLLSISLIICGLALAMGGYSPIFRWIVHHGWKYFNCPARFFFYVQVGLVFLTAVGLDFCISHLELKRVISKNIIISFLIIGTVVPVLLVGWFWYHGMPWKYTGVPMVAKMINAENDFSRIVSREKISDITPDNDFGVMVGNSIDAKRTYRQSFVSPFESVNGVSLKISRSGSEGGLIGLVLYAADGKKLREAKIDTQNITDNEWSDFIFPPIKNAKDVSYFFEISSNINDASKAPRLIVHANPVAQYNPSGNLYRCLNGVCDEVKIKLNSADAAFKVITSANQADELHEALAPYVSAGFGVGSTLWAGSLPILDVRNYIKPLGGWGDSIRHNTRTLINRFSTTHLIGLFPAFRYADRLEGASLLGSVPFGNSFIRVYRNEQALPRLHFVKKVKVMSDSTKQINALFQFDPLDQGTVFADLKDEVSFDLSGNVARIIKDGRTEVIIQTEQKNPGFLVLRDVFLGGWEVNVDGKPDHINRVDGVFRGVIVPAGKHLVVYRYLPRWITPAVCVECFSIIIFILLILIEKTQKKKQK